MDKLIHIPSSITKIRIRGIEIDLKVIKIIIPIRIMDSIVTLTKSFEVTSSRSEYMAASPVRYHSLNLPFGAFFILFIS